MIENGKYRNVKKATERDAVGSPANIIGRGKLYQQELRRNGRDPGNFGLSGGDRRG